MLVLNLPSHYYASLSSIWNILAVASCLWLLCKAGEIIYNVYFHPLARFPGPRLAAATGWWKAYVECSNGHGIADRIELLHARYGDIVRLTPNEVSTLDLLNRSQPWADLNRQLSFSRPTAYNEVYKPRWAKEKTFYHAFNAEESSFGILDPAASKARRDVVNPFFSRRAIIELQDVVQAKIDEFCSAVNSRYNRGLSSDLFYGMRCVATDVITSYCFAQSMNTLQEPDFQAPIIHAVEASLPPSILFRHFWLIKTVVLSLPPWLTVFLLPKLQGLIDMQRMIRSRALSFSNDPTLLRNFKHPTIYSNLLDPAAYKNGQLPSKQSIYDEAEAMVFAGTDTTGNTFMVGMFHLMSDGRVRGKLVEELRSFWPDISHKPRYEDIEKLPYLTAVVKESLRCSLGCVTPMPRVVSSPGATISGEFIPGGTVVGVSTLFIHHNPAIFPDPHAFVPERWLGAEGKDLDSCLVVFGRGQRSCLGMNLAWCELYLGLANIFRRFDPILDGSKLSDIAYYRPYILPQFVGQHLRAFMKPVED
ncbi:MAG: hypothetical protein M1817_002164 [Caeruleum heppii]|nr:MAG: hypothetical protein M1817_002164 [Caeruleum heppii]